MQVVYINVSIYISIVLYIVYVNLDAYVCNLYVYCMYSVCIYPYFMYIVLMYGVCINIYTYTYTKYENHPIRKEHLRDQWKERCKKEEIKSSQIWQDKEANIRSNIDTNIIPNSIERDSNEESRHVTKRTLKNVEDGEQEVLTDNTLAILREHERAYMEELERKMHAEESGEFFDDSALEKIGGNIDKLEKVLGTHNNRNKCANGKRPDARIDSSDDCSRADTAEVPNFEDKIGLRTKIPIPDRKLMRAKRKSNLASHDND